MFSVFIGTQNWQRTKWSEVFKTVLLSQASPATANLWHSNTLGWRPFSLSHPCLHYFMWLEELLKLLKLLSGQKYQGWKIKWMIALACRKSALECFFSVSKLLDFFFFFLTEANNDPVSWFKLKGIPPISLIHYFFSIIQSIFFRGPTICNSVS